MLETKFPKPNPKEKIEDDNEEVFDEEMPKKRIKGDGAIQKWIQTIAYNRFLTFVQMVNYSLITKSPEKEKENKTKEKEKSVGDLSLEKVIRIGEKNNFYKQNEKGSKAIKGILKMLEEVEKLVKETNLIEKSSLQRFGNPGYRDFFDKMMNLTPNLVEKLMKKTGILDTYKDNKVLNNSRIKKELSVYFSEGWGNRTRIDYGSGHEAAFLLFLCSLKELGVFKDLNDLPFIATRVFKNYLSIVRLIQVKFSLEPAGSRGSYGLDDFQFIPFMWGSAQLIDHPEIQPNMILDEAVHKAYDEYYLYFDAIKFINKTKKGPFNEHSSVLFSLTTCPHWKKINEGMIKMYIAELLKKFVVVQHFYFGKILPYETDDDLKSDESFYGNSKEKN